MNEYLKHKKVTLFAPECFSRPTNSTIVTGHHLQPHLRIPHAVDRDNIMVMAIVLDPHYTTAMSCVAHACVISLALS